MTRDESGFAVVFFALTITAMMMFVATVVDLGAGYSERREDVSATDGAVLAGLQEDNDADRRTTAIQVANNTLGESLSVADYNTCAGDPNVLPVVDSAANCISYNTLRTKMRVRLPSRSLAYFSQAGGLPEVEHSANATGEIATQGGGILPFALQLGSGVGDGYECLKSQSANVGAPECDGPDSGNFRHLDFTFYDAAIGSGINCTSGGGSERLPHNIAAGVDHDLSKYTGVEVNEFSYCPSAAAPNTTDTQTGNVPAKVGEGMWAGDSYRDGRPARLRRMNPDLTWSTTRTLDGKQLDNNPIWDFIPNSRSSTGSPYGLSDVPWSCYKDQFVGYDVSQHTGGLNKDNDYIMSAVEYIWPDTETYLFDPNNDGDNSDAFTDQERLIKLIQRCFTHYNGNAWDDGGKLWNPEPVQGCTGTCDGAVFSRNSSIESPDLWDIQMTARFAYVPELTTTPIAWNGNTKVHFQAFRPVFIQRVYMGNCGGGACQFAFDPGIGTSEVGAIEDKAGAVTAFVFNGKMLPGDLGDEDAPFALGVNRFIFLVD